MNAAMNIAASLAMDEAANIEALEAAVDAFLAIPQAAPKEDEFTDRLAVAQGTSVNEYVSAMERLLTETLLPLNNKMIRICGLADTPKLNGRVGIVLKETKAPRPGRVACSLAATETWSGTWSPIEWVHVKLTNLRPATVQELQGAVTAAIGQGKMTSFQELLSPPATAFQNSDDDDGAQKAAAVRALVYESLVQGGMSPADARNFADTMPQSLIDSAQEEEDDDEGDGRSDDEDEEEDEDSDSDSGDEEKMKFYKVDLGKAVLIDESGDNHKIARQEGMTVRIGKPELGGDADLGAPCE